MFPKSQALICYWSFSTTQKCFKYELQETRRILTSLTNQTDFFMRVSVSSCWESVFNITEFQSYVICAFKNRTQTERNKSNWPFVSFLCTFFRASESVRSGTWSRLHPEPSGPSTRRPGPPRAHHGRGVRPGNPSQNPRGGDGGPPETEASAHINTWRDWWDEWTTEMWLKKHSSSERIMSADEENNLKGSDAVLFVCSILKNTTAARKIIGEGK